MLVILHALLSWSSLLLPLPKKRNYKGPMIWIEFRLHSIIFATRHVISTVISLNQMWPSSENMFLRTLSKIFLVVATSRLAGLVTSTYDGCENNRTTNSMPYPTWTTRMQQRYVKFMYAKTQFFATVGVMFDDPSLNFAPVLAIQIAPLMMTLVRKGKSSPMWYHRIYSISLWLSYFAGAGRMMASGDGDGFILSGLTVGWVIFVRISYGYPHWILWSICGMTLFNFYPTWIRPFLIEKELIGSLNNFSMVVAAMPVGWQLLEWYLDPRPVLESLMHWPFFMIPEDYCEKYRFLSTNYHQKEVPKMETMKS